MSPGSKSAAITIDAREHGHGDADQRAVALGVSAHRVGGGDEHEAMLRTGGGRAEGHPSSPEPCDAHAGEEGRRLPHEQRSADDDRARVEPARARYVLEACDLIHAHSAKSGEERSRRAPVALAESALPSLMAASPIGPRGRRWSQASEPGSPCRRRCPAPTRPRTGGRAATASRGHLGPAPAAGCRGSGPICARRVPDRGRRSRSPPLAGRVEGVLTTRCAVRSTPVRHFRRSPIHRATFEMRGRRCMSGSSRRARLRHEDGPRPRGEARPAAGASRRVRRDRSSSHAGRPGPPRRGRRRRGPRTARPGRPWRRALDGHV